MTQDKKILDFAMKYYYLYLNPQTTEGEVTNGFAEACRDLGFSPEGNPYELLPDRRKAGYIFLSEEDAERGRPLHPGFPYIFQVADHCAEKERGLEGAPHKP